VVSERLTMREAINRALADELERDARVILFGEDIGPLGGIFRVTDGLQARFGVDRVFDTPSAEAGIAGVALGMAMAGWRPVAEMQFDGFSYPSLDQVISHVARYRMRTKSAVTLPLVIRMPCGGGLKGKESHAESPEAYFCATPGLKVVCPSGAAEAYELVTQAIRDPDPVIVLEPKRLYDVEENVEDLGHGDLPIHQARVARDGTDLTIVTYGGMVGRSIEAADQLEREGISVQVLDLRSLAPIDIESLRNCVRLTGRAVVVHEAPMTMGLGAEISTRITEECFDRLKAAVIRVTGYDTPYPPPLLQDAAWFPTVERIIDGCRRVLPPAPRDPFPDDPLEEVIGP
jgi:pyruvate/2-oxoglutarate/acetoin dehydrogenase E1 component